MAVKTTTQTRRDVQVAAPIQAAAPQGGQFLVFRETIESIVVAFVLAFLFRSFEAEAFIIPTGSMSPSLLGQHKDCNCTQCGFTFRATASSEGEERDKLMAMQKGLSQEIQRRGEELNRFTRKFGPDSPQTQRLAAEVRQLEGEYKFRHQTISSYEVVGGMCPMCRYLMPMRPDLPQTVRDEVDVKNVEFQPSYPGDRILVNKYGFDFSEPERWDVVVFKFPGDGNMNYIKRLTGLPGEVVRVYQGDLFTRPLKEADASFKIESKPADKAAAMLHLVHDTDYEPTVLHEAGWPLRWAATTADGWKVDATPGEQTVAQRFHVDSQAGSGDAWLRYRHLTPSVDVWRAAQAFPDEERFAELLRSEGETLTRDEWRQHVPEVAKPELISDFNAYNARLCRGFAERDGWRIVPSQGQQNSGSLGTEWVGDLAVECDVEVEADRGELVLDLVEAGYHFQAAINLKDGEVQFSILDGRTGTKLPFEAKRKSAVTGAGNYELRFANVDDQLLLWVDGDLIEGGAAAYDPDKLFEGGRQGMLPWASDDGAGDQGDLAPVGVAARGAKLSVSRLAVSRDIYYIATKYPVDSMNFTTDYAPTPMGTQELLSRKEAWEHFRTRHHRDFPVDEKQLLVLGDNSPESKDCRLWMWASPAGTDRPGGPYLDRQLLIGKAICVFWPHSWGSVPGLPMLPGFPNFRDMRLVR